MNGDWFTSFRSSSLWDFSYSTCLWVWSWKTSIDVGPSKKKKKGLVGPQKEPKRSRSAGEVWTLQSLDSNAIFLFVNYFSSPIWVAYKYTTCYLGRGKGGNTRRWSSWGIRLPRHTREYRIVSSDSENSAPNQAAGFLMFFHHTISFWSTRLTTSKLFARKILMSFFILIANFETRRIAIRCSIGLLPTYIHMYLPIFKIIISWYYYFIFEAHYLQQLQFLLSSFIYYLSSPISTIYLLYHNHISPADQLLHCTAEIFGFLKAFGQLQTPRLDYENVM